MKTKLVPFLLLLVLGGCSMAPRYSRPAMPVAGAWPPADASTQPPAIASPAGPDWRTTFTDPKMQVLIERALLGNRDLRVAALNVERAAAMFRIQRSELYPGFGVQAAGQRYRLPETMNSDGQASTIGQYSVAVGIPTWEIDLFGRVGSLKESALHQYLATEHARAAAELSLISAVAASYVALAADNENLALARSTLRANRASYDLIAQSRDLGVATDLDVNQARSLVESTRADVARLHGNVRVDQNALSLLVGEPFSAEMLPDGLGAVAPVAAIEPGLPSEVLLRRPDILAAEEALIAANANIGAARAAFFPRVTLTASAGTLSPEVSALFGSGTGTWSFAPQIVAPIFAGGALRANLTATKASRDIAVARYEKAIQSAFAEVSDALSNRLALADEQAAVEALVTALEQSQRLATARYEAGIDSYLQVLIVERSLFAARQRLVGLRYAEQNNRITMFKVVAGEPPGTAGVSPASPSGILPAGSAETPKSKPRAPIR